MNTEAKHTPGPWSVYPDGINHYVMWDEDDNFPVNCDESTKLANARLIATAPELLAALDFLLAYSHGSHNDKQGAQAMATRAIAKAKGEA